MRGNQAPCINKVLEKATYTRTRLKTEYWPEPSKNKPIYVCQ